MLSDQTLLQLSKAYQTPFFIYNGDVIKEKYQELQHAFKNCKRFQVNYAVKALSTIGILKFIQQLGASVDVVSLNEIKIAMLAGFLPKNISFTPNGTPFNEIVEASKLGVHITLDNLIQIKQYTQLRTGTAIGIRINPRITAGGNAKIIVGEENSKFGLPLSDVDTILDLVKIKKLKVDGFHIHLGSDILNSDSFIASSKLLFSVAKQFKNLKFINFGGGFKVKYKKDDAFLNIDIVGNNLTKVFQDFQKDYHNELKLIIEPGKFLVSNAGLFLSRITTINANNVFVNSGMNHFIRPMYYDAFHNIRNLSNTDITLKTYNIVGYICEQDSFGKTRNVGNPTVGDIICMENTGAYSFTMASNYNSRLKPLELFHYNNEVNIIRKKETFNDLLNNQVY
jgi:diaminopimelate decarboxylase